MLNAAIETIADLPNRPVVHSDRGAHYRWPRWLGRMRDARLIRSLSRKGCTKTTIEEFMQALDAYIRWYNQHRIKLSLGGMSPVECRQHLGIAA